MTARAQTHIILLIRVRYRTSTVLHRAVQRTDVWSETSHHTHGLLFLLCAHASLPQASNIFVWDFETGDLSFAFAGRAHGEPESEETVSCMESCAQVRISCAYIVRIDGVVHGVSCAQVPPLRVVVHGVESHASNSPRRR